MRGKLARQPTGPAGLLTFRPFGTESPKRQRHYGNGVTERQYTDTVLRKRLWKRIRMNGNVRLKTRLWMESLKYLALNRTRVAVVCARLQPVDRTRPR